MDPEVESVTEVAKALSGGIQAYCLMMHQAGTTLNMGTVISALLSLAALYMDEAPEEWRDHMISQFIQRCSPKAIN